MTEKISLWPSILGNITRLSLVFAYFPAKSSFFILKICLKQPFDCCCFSVDYFVQKIVLTILWDVKEPTHC